MIHQINVQLNLTGVGLQSEPSQCDIMLSARASGFPKISDGNGRNANGLLKISDGNGHNANRLLKISDGNDSM
jgi:hypothetical protein